MRRLVAVVLAAPFVFAQDPASKPAAVDFDKQIAPMLASRCISCHGAKEQKGDLRLDTKASLFAAAKDKAGDKDARPVVPGKPDESDLVRRISLPPGDDDLMPAKGEPLGKEQQELFRRWVAEGATWPATGDESIAKELAAMVLPKITFELPAVDAKAQAAIDAAVAELKRRGALVQQVAADTTAIDVNLSLLRDKVTDADLALLPPLAPRLVWLNVSRTAISDAAAKDLASLTQLRRLHAANTKLGDATFVGLGELQQLEYVNAYGTALTDTGLGKLAALPKLTRLYVWQSKVTVDGAKAARAQAPKLQLDLGDYVDERMAAAQKEVEERNARNKPVNETCPVMTDKKVDPAHTIEFEGRRIGFCCAKCKAAFQKDSAKYLANLPAKTDAPAEKPADKPADKPVDKPINEKCPVSGEAVDAAHTIEFEGRRIGFCCGKCKAAFEKEPAKYAANLPPKK